MRHETDVLQYIRSTFKSWGFLKQIKKLLGQATGISGTSSKAKLPIRPTDRGLSAYRQLRPKESISHGLTGYPINGTTDWFEHKVETIVAPLPSTGDFKLSISA